VIPIRRIVIDCDPGIDDAVALLYAFGSKETVVDGANAVFGNASVRQTTRNLLTVIELSNLRDAPPVGVGSVRPLHGSRIRSMGAHGRDGMGDAGLPPPERSPAFQDAERLFVSALGSRGADTLVSTGPLTDVAKFITRYPAIANTMRRLFVMAGALRTGGSFTPYAEFNAYSDPWALDEVLSSGLPVTLVGLDVTRTALLGAEDIGRFSARGGKVSRFLAKALSGYAAFTAARWGVKACPLHDALCMALALDEGLGTYERLSLCVETSGKRRGMLRVVRGRPTVRFCRKVDSRAFVRELFKRLGAVPKSPRPPTSNNHRRIG